MQFIFSPPPARGRMCAEKIRISSLAREIIFFSFGSAKFSLEMRHDRAGRMEAEIGDDFGQIDDFFDFTGDEDDGADEDTLPPMIAHPLDEDVRFLEGGPSSYCSAATRLEEDKISGFRPMEEEQVYDEAEKEQLQWLSNFLDDSGDQSAPTGLLFITNNVATSAATAAASASCSLKYNNAIPFHTQSPVSVFNPVHHCRSSSSATLSSSSSSSSSYSSSYSSPTISCAFSPSEQLALLFPSRARTKRARYTSFSNFVATPGMLTGGESSSESDSQVITILTKKKIKRNLVGTGEEDGAAGDVASPTVRKCTHCQITRTPQWRSGPMGPKTLCNACGVRYKSGRLFPEYRPAASPTFIASIHSNSHKKVVEIRNTKTPSAGAAEDAGDCVGFRKSSTSAAVKNCELIEYIRRKEY